MTALLRLLDLIPVWVWALLLAASVATSTYLGVRLGFSKAATTTAQADATLAKANFKTCQGNTVTLERALDEQNAAVSALKKAGEDQAKKSLRALDEARSIARAGDVNVARAMAVKLTGECVADMAELAKEARK